METILPASTPVLCPKCFEACLCHNLITLHAAEETLRICEGAWEELPAHLREGFKLAADAKTRGLVRRREAVQEIRYHLNLQPNNV